VITLIRTTGNEINVVPQFIIAMEEGRSGTVVTIFQLGNISVKETPHDIHRKIKEETYRAD
jgi:hypothetical protein